MKPETGNSSVECDLRNSSFNQCNFSEGIMVGDESDRHPCNQCSSPEDPLIESTCSLQSVQEALEQEVKNFAKIGNEPFSHDDDDDDSTKLRSEAAGVSAVDLGSEELCLSAELEKYSADILLVEESFMIQRRACKLTFFLFLQFMWLIMVIVSLVMWPSSSDSGVVILIPT